jgi:general secretion pathway protein D
MTQALVFQLGRMVRRTATLLLMAATVGLVACQPTLLPLPGPLEFPRSPKSDGGVINPSRDGRPTATQVTALPGQPTPQGSAPTSPAAPQAQAPAGPGDEVSMAIEQTPLPVFLQILYGNVLKKSYSLDPAVQARTDLVTFKTSVPIGRERMQAVAVNLLRSYGLTVQDFDGLVRILPEANAPASPVLRRGRSLPETPESSRPIFQHVELEVVRSTEAMQWMRQILGNRVTMQDDPNRNGMLLSGTPGDLRTALDMVQALDQPRMRGRVARRISPAYANVNDFSLRLVEVLGAQGYTASSTLTNAVPILILPIPAISSVVAFTNSEATMEHVLRWARELDKPVGGATSSGLYTYAVKYADAQDLARTLGDLLGGGGQAAPAAASTGTGAAASTARASSSGRVVVNNATNTLIFKGSSADEYQQIQALLRELDRPAKSALIEVVVAELKRGSAQSLGVQWSYNRDGVATRSQQFGSAGGTGFNFSVTNNPLQVLSAVNALASSDQARVLSNPKIIARNGEAATIQVGSEVPVITSQQSTGSSGGFFTPSTPNLIQTVQYRSTGVILRVRPVINSGNRLDLEIQQEVSTPGPTSTGVTASPTINTRRVETKLSIRDGSTVLIGGLIERTTIAGNTGVPLLKDIPFIGSLFKSETSSIVETELIVMITPYVINDDYEAEGISDAMQAGFGEWAQTLKKARVGERLKDEAESYARPPAAIDISAPIPADPPDAPMPKPMGSPETPVTRPAPAGAPVNIMEGITTTPAPKAPTETTGKAAAGAVKKPPAAGKADKPAAPASAASAPPAPSTTPPPANAPIKGGQTVDDEKVKEEIRKLFEGKR